MQTLLQGLTKLLVGPTSSSDKAKAYTLPHSPQMLLDAFGQLLVLQGPKVSVAPNKTKHVRGSKLERLDVKPSLSKMLRCGLMFN